MPAYKYEYYANVCGEKICCKTIKQLVTVVNESFGFPILTYAKANNYFVRPHRMQRTYPTLARFNITRKALHRDSV